MNTGPPRDISHAEQRSRSREDVPGGAARLPLALRPRPVGQPRPQLLQAGNGAVIAIASMYGLVGQYERVAYCGAKAGMIGMVRAMALDFADKGVRVNAIAPGFIETDLARGIAAQEPDPEAAMRTRRAMHAIPRAGQPEEIGEAAAYLASDAASFMTGQCLTLDGVYGAVRKGPLVTRSGPEVRSSGRTGTDGRHSGNPAIRMCSIQRSRLPGAVHIFPHSRRSLLMDSPGES